MFGTGLLKGLGVTMKRFVDTYVDDVKHIPSRYAHGYDTLRQTPEEKGIFTIQYPEEKRQLPERFRYIPMLIYDTPKGEDRCTACGICAKVCPPQCIWIVRHKDESGKPVPRAGEFFIDASICMSCGFCAEYCPFDAIKMNHDYELAVYDRFPGLIYNMTELTVPLEYYASIYPTQFVEEEARRAEEEAKKAKKPARGAKAEAKPAAAAAAPAPAAAPAAAVAGASALSAEELERRRAEAKARVAARKGEAAAPEAAAAPPAVAAAVSPPAAAAPAATPAVAAATVAAGSPFAKMAADPSKTSGGYTQDEIAAKRAESYARYQARKGADAKQLHGAAEPVAPQAAAKAPAVETPSPAPELVQPAAAIPVAAVEKPAAPAASGSPFAKMAADPAKTSGGYTMEEIARRRAESYARYKARKGADAKDLGSH